LLPIRQLACKQPANKATRVSSQKVLREQPQDCTAPQTDTSTHQGEAKRRHQCAWKASAALRPICACDAICNLAATIGGSQGMPSTCIYTGLPNKHRPTQSTAPYALPPSQKAQNMHGLKTTSSHTTQPAPTPVAQRTSQHCAAETPVSGWTAAQLPYCCLQLTSCVLRCDVAPTKLYRCCCTAATLHHGILACPLACCVLVPGPV
jgi:hypothetical protein